MNITACNFKNDEIDIAWSKHGLKLKSRHSFIRPDRSVRSYNIKESDYRSKFSECSSPGLDSRGMSTNDSIAEDDGLSHKAGPTITEPPTAFTMPYSYQMSPVQLTGSLVYQPLVYNQQHQIQRGYHFSPRPVRVPSFGNKPFQILPMPISLTISQHIFFPGQQNQPKPKEWMRLPIPTITSVPRMRDRISYPLQNDRKFQLESSTVVSNMLSSPLLSLNTPNYVNAYYFSTSVISASYTTIHGSLTHPDIPPLLDLNSNYLQGRTISKQTSCNISMGPTPSGYQNVSGRHESLSANSSQTLMNQKKSTKTYFSISEPAKNIEKKATQGKKQENLWLGTCKYNEWQHKGESNLFITWQGSASELVKKLQGYKLQVRNIFKTRDKNVHNVIFESHPIARKAFTMQQRIRLRAVPPKNSPRIWWRNPSPTFPVKFEAKIRLVVRKGKAECHDIVGELPKGCLFTANQQKGNSIRVLCCDGSFVFPEGEAMWLKGDPSNSGKKVGLGWISCRGKYSKQWFVKRRSWSMLSDYIYNE